MCNTYSSSFHHCVWSTKTRYPFLIEPFASKAKDLIKKTLEDKGAKVIAIEVMPDHVHVLISIKTTHSMALLMKDAKGLSSRILTDSYKEMHSFSWQRSYGAISVEFPRLESLIDYIQNQKIHHAKKSFEVEYRDLLTHNGIKFDEKYLYD